MSQAEPITRELTIWEVFSKTFGIFRKYFVRNLVLFLIFESLIGIFQTAVNRAITLPSVPASPTPTEALAVFPTLIADVLLLFVGSLLVIIVFYPLEVAGALKMTSDEIERGEADLGPSVRYAASKLVSIWVVSIIVGIIVLLGFIALIIPGVILSIMYSLFLPALVIEQKGVFGSMKRSRQLVKGRWLKTLAFGLVLGLTVVVADLIVTLIAGPFGIGSTLVTDMLGSLYLPLVPISLTVYFYSNRARIEPQAQSMEAAGIPSGGVPATGVRYCPNCGAQLPATAGFCPNCGAKTGV